MAILPGTNIPDRLVPFDSNDSYPTHLDVYGKGGYRVVDSVLDRDSITLGRQTVNMLVYVTSDNTLYKLMSTAESLNSSNWQVVTLISGGTSLSALAGEDITGQLGIYIADNGLVYTASNTNLSIIHKQIYISANSALNNSQVNLLTEGDFWSEAGWSWIPGNSIFLGINGSLTQTPNTTGFQRVVASAVTSTKIKIVSSPSILLG